MIVRWTKLGLHVDGAWFCSNACVEADAARRLREVRPREIASRAPVLRLGAVLLHQGVVTPGQLGEALETQRTTGLRLGAQLQALGHLSRDLALRALSAQNGVSYLKTIDSAAVRTAPGGLSVDEVRALGIVPFRDAGDRLLVACAAPVPTTARDIADRASRIAALAAAAGDGTVDAAHLDPFTWVRVAANGRISTLLVPPSSHHLKENAEWLAATTQH